MAAPWLVALASSALEAQKRKEEQKRARRGARADIAGQHVQSLGYPSYGMQAARHNAAEAQANQRKSPISAMLPFIFNKGDGMPPVAAQEAEDEEGARRYRGFSDSMSRFGR